MPDAVQSFSPMKRAHRSARAVRVALARTDVNAFVTYVMKDEENPTVPLKQSAMHEAWHQILDQFSRVVIFSFISSGKSQQISIGRVLWELGRNSSIRVVIVSNTQMQAEKLVRSVATYVEKSSELHEVFPHLRPATPWNVAMITIERSGVAKDPTVQGVGIHSNILGARSDLVVLDDVCDYENSRTPLQREDLISW